MQDRHILCNLLAPLANFAFPFPNLFKDRGVLQSLGSMNCKWAKIVTKHWVPRLLSGGTAAADQISILSRARGLVIGGSHWRFCSRIEAYLLSIKNCQSSVGHVAGQWQL
jgi:hypothetical protein